MLYSYNNAIDLSTYSLYKAIDSILRQMLLGQLPDTWVNKQSTLLSILATRVQMGQTSALVASTLVSEGYARLTSFSISDDHHFAGFCYFCDPLCARIAML